MEDEVRKPRQKYKPPDLHVAYCKAKWRESMPLLCKAQKMTKLIKFKLRWIIMKLKIEEKKVILVWWKLFKANT